MGRLSLTILWVNKSPVVLSAVFLLHLYYFSWLFSCGCSLCHLLTSGRSCCDLPNTFGIMVEGVLKTDWGCALKYSWLIFRSMQFIGTSQANSRADRANSLGVMDLWTPENHYRWNRSLYGSQISASVTAIRASRLFSESTFSHIIFFCSPDTLPIFHLTSIQCWYGTILV